MKALDTVYILLIAGFLFGLPAAASYRTPGQEFSTVQAFEQAGIVAGILLTLLGITVLLARIIHRRKP